MKQFLICLLFLIFSLPQAYSTHLKAGEITAERKPGNSYKFTLIVYMDSAAIAVNPALDEPVAVLFINGIKSPNFPRVSQAYVGHGTLKNTYVLDNYVLSPGVYTISYNAENRNRDILNINGGSTDQIPFYLETKINFDPFVGLNSTPVLLFPPIDVATVGQKYIHNPAAFDFEGDSISYQLARPKQSSTTDVPRYIDPNLVQPSAATFSLNPVTGDLIWDAPTLAGRYNVAFLIIEWRNGEKLGIIERDMQIEVVPSFNRPPVLGESLDTCIVAGSSFSKIISAFDPDGDHIYLTTSNTPASGIYSLFSSPPVFTLSSGPNPEASPASGVFNWNTNCSHIRKQPYQVEFKAEDVPPLSRKPSLVDLQYLRITVIAPAPTGLNASPVSNGIYVSWNVYSCPMPLTKMEIYRRECDSTALPFSTCQVGIPSGSGFVKIGEVAIGIRTFTDTIGLKRGTNYCYVVAAAFPAPSGGQSYPSNMACSALDLDQPVILNANVDATDSLNGKITVRWTQPQPLPLPGPYQYIIFRAAKISGDDYFPIDTIIDINQTFMVDSIINTVDSSYNYQIKFYYNGGNTLKGTSDPASMVRLTVQPGNTKAFLTWKVFVPWEIDYFRIYRTLEGVTTLIDSVNADSLNNTAGFYTDTNLSNKDTVCYYIESIGNYCDVRLPSTLINRSEEFCVVPRDSTPPCPPVLFLKAINCSAPKVFANDLNWVNDPRSICDHDIKGYNLYYAQYEDETPSFLKFIPLDTFYVDVDSVSLSGCYKVTAINYYNVESLPSNKVCIDNCSYYQLPNLITANADSRNDVFKPYPVPQNVESVDFFVYNVWGELVYHSSNDIFLNWHGVSGTGRELNEGIYYYLAKVKLIRRLRKQDEKFNLKGWVHLIKGDGATER